MTTKDLIDACDILVKLEQEFSTEEAKLSEISNGHAVRIDELDQQITTFRRNEDVDFRVFSPRNISTGTSDKIKALEEEKKNLEREKRDADKQLKYYSGKTDMISKVLGILRGDLAGDQSEDEKDPEGFVFDEVIEDKQVDDVAELFRQSDEELKTVEPEDEEPVTVDAVVTTSAVPVEEVERVCHKVEFCEKIMTNDGIRARIEIKNLISELRDIIRAYK